MAEPTRSSELGRWTAEDWAAVRTASDAGDLPAEVALSDGRTVVVCLDEVASFISTPDALQWMRNLARAARKDGLPRATAAGPWGAFLAYGDGEVLSLDECFDDIRDNDTRHLRIRVARGSAAPAESVDGDGFAVTRLPADFDAADLHGEWTDLLGLDAVEYRLQQAEATAAALNAVATAAALNAVATQIGASHPLNEGSSSMAAYTAGGPMHARTDRRPPGGAHVSNTLPARRS